MQTSNKIIKHVPYPQKKKLSSQNAQNNTKYAEEHKDNAETKWNDFKYSHSIILKLWK